MQTETNTMSQSTGHTSSDQNRNNSHYSTSEITGTPFTLISGESENFIAWGKYRLTGTMKTPFDCYEYLETNKWELLVNVVVAVLQAREEYMESLKRRQGLTLEDIPGFGTPTQEQYERTMAEAEAEEANN